MPALPSASAITRPTRVPAPVTSATRPSSSISRSSWRAGRRCDCSHFLILPLEPFERHVHYSEAARSVRCSVPIRSTARHEVEEISERLKPLDVFRRMAGMLYLQTIESRRDQGLEPLASAAVARVRPDRQRAGLMRDRDRALDRETLPGDERAPGVAEVSRERIPKLVDYATRDKGSRHVRTSDRAAVGLLKYLVQRERNAERVEFLDDLPGARVAICAQLAETHFQGLEAGEVQRQQVDFVVFLKSAQLHPGYYPNAQSLTGHASRRNSVDRVVIRECQGREAAALGGLDYPLGRDRTVRGSRVTVQVDERRPARIHAHRA